MRPATARVFSQLARNHGLDQNCEFRDEIESEAIADGLRKEWLIVMDDAVRREREASLRSIGLGEPELGWVANGKIDFTPAGGELWKEYLSRYRGKDRCWEDIHLERRMTSIMHFRSLEQAKAEVDRWNQMPGATVRGPTAVGPWRRLWWERFESGYRVEVTETEPWRGPDNRYGERCNGRSGRYQRYETESRKPSYRHFCRKLARYGINIDIWNILWELSRRPADFHSLMSADFCGEYWPGRTKSHDHFYNMDITVDSLTKCLIRGWIRKIDRNAVNEVHAILAADRTILAMPRTATLLTRRTHLLEESSDGTFRIVPASDKHRFREYDFTTEGALIFERLDRSLLGIHKHCDLSATNVANQSVTSYFLERDRAMQFIGHYPTLGVDLASIRLIELGPWCARWWDRYPNGYRLDLEMGNAAMGTELGL